MSGRRAHMQRALELAARGWGQTAPNPMVGAVLVRDGTIVGEGWHERYGGAHAEIKALSAAGALARGAHLYVTLEPCAHHGKTPPCTASIIEAGVGAVSIGVPDPTAAGGGAGILRDAGIAVSVGVLGEAARELNAGFHFAATADRPWATLKLALSVEGAIAPARTDGGAREQVWLTGEAARAEVHRLRAGSDAVAVGVGTVLADDPRLTVRYFSPPRVPPTRVVFDRGLRTPENAAVVRTAREGPVIVITADDTAPAAAALRSHGVDVIAAPDIAMALRELRGRGIRSLLVEGGAGLAAALIDADLVDRLVLLRSPVSLGTDALQAFAGVADVGAFQRRLHLQREAALGEDVMAVYAVAGHDV